MRLESEGRAVEWVREGRRQPEGSGGEELLHCQFFLQEDGSWRDAGLGTLPTQVRENEEEEVLRVLLEKLLLRLDSYLDGQISEEDFRDNILWFGPEMAEEY